MLHHVVFLDDGAPGTAPRGACGGRHGRPFYGTGEEHQQLVLPPGYGYPLHRRDRWRMQVMLMSHSIRPARVYVEWTMRIRTGPSAHAGHPVLDPPERVRGELHRPRRRAARQHRSPLRDLARPGRRADRGRRRPPARGGAGPQAERPWLPPRAPRRPTALRAPRRPGLRGAPRPPRARADRDPLLPLAGPGSRSAGASPCGSPGATTASTRVRGSCRSSTSTSRRRGAAPALAAHRSRADRRELLTRGDGRTDPPYEPVPFTVMDDQGGIEQVGDLPGLPAPLGAGGTVDLVGTASPPRRSRSRSAGSCAGASATPRSTTSCSPTDRPWSARPRAAAGRRRRGSAGPGPTGSSAPAPDHDAPGGRRRVSHR